MYFLFRFINDKPVEEGNKFKTLKHPGFENFHHTLDIEPAELEDSGIIKAVATNKVGEANTTAKLNVEGEDHMM